MKKNITSTLTFAFCFLLCLNLSAQKNSITQVKLTDFDLQSEYLVTDAGSIISTPNYKSSIYWFPVKVPSTVLTGLVANKIYPSPYLGLNITWSSTALSRINPTHGKNHIGTAQHLK
jgi:hypothetical protein